MKKYSSMILSTFNSIITGILMLSIFAYISALATAPIWVCALIIKWIWG